MNWIGIAGSVVGVTLGLVALGTAQDRALDHWPSWRGPLSNGTAPRGTPPIEWSEQRNIRWKTEIAGRGHSTPIVWGDHVFVTSAVPFGDKFEPRFSGAPGAHDNSPVSQRHRYAVTALDRSDGSVRWTRNVREAIPHEGAHYSASLASASPVTDGQYVYVSFGSQGIFCFDFAGELIWEKDLGRMDTKHGHGEGSSPLLFEQTLVVNWDHEGQSFIAAYQAKTGEEIWKKERREVTSWATPIAVKHGDGVQLIVPGTDRLRAYDLANGNILWECGGLSANIVASPVAYDGMVFAGSSYEKRALLAIALEGATGDITETDHVIWKRTQSTPYVPSPLLFNGALYYLRHYQGIMTRLDAKTGRDSPGAFRLRVVSEIYASPVAADNRVYISGLDGTTVVLTGDEVPRPLAVNRLDEGIYASAAIAGDEIFLRGIRSVYCIGESD